MVYRVKVGEAKGIVILDSEKSTNPINNNDRRLRSFDG